MTSVVSNSNYEAFFEIAAAEAHWVWVAVAQEIMEVAHILQVWRFDPWRVLLTCQGVVTSRGSSVCELVNERPNCKALYLFSLKSTM